MNYELPCYAGRIYCASNKSHEQIRKEIDKALIALNADIREEHDVTHGVLVLSITTVDKKYQNWLDVVEEYNNSTICHTISNHNEKRSCFLCMIPVFENLGKDE